MTLGGRVHQSAVFALELGLEGEDAIVGLTATSPANRQDGGVQALPV